MTSSTKKIAKYQMRVKYHVQGNDISFSRMKYQIKEILIVVLFRSIYIYIYIYDTTISIGVLML